ncbi:MAG: prepilin-type N-terminal cleavage/methylation domain-containing protein [Proteobacteria bacterium]|nr:prepilin-type N-terminal cleavage/methylation domain-containing protein [Pseudomonadota bacterium]
MFFKEKILKSFCEKNLKKAFSLIELSIVIVIVSILITGALSVSVNAINSAKNKITKDRITEIYKALGNYVVVNKKLPCPAPITDTKSITTTYGTSLATCAATTGVVAYPSSTNLLSGMLPVKTLGLPLDMAEDGFGDKFEYIVDLNYTIASAGTAVTSGVGDFGTSTTANISIKEKPNTTDITIETTAVFAIVSLGANKYGAYGYDSSTSNTAPTDAQELRNVTPSSSSNATATLYVSSATSDAFDDIVFYKTRQTFISDFNALSLMPCLTTTETLYGGTITWPTAWYNQVVTATSPTCSSLGYSAGPVKPTKRCGAFGVWDVVINPCLQ